MTISQHVTTFAGLPVVEFGLEAPPPADPGGVAWRVSAGYEETAEFEAKTAALLGAPWAGEIRALLIGDWGNSFDSTVPIEPIVAAADRLRSLTAIFLAEITYEECEISWIQSTDVTPLLAAFPGLEVLRARGGDGLAVQPGRYPRLRELAFEAGGLSPEAIRAVGDCDLPGLHHLELWLGTANYGGNAIPDDLTTIMTGSRLPALEYLGLRDAEIADDVAGVVAGAAVVGRLSTLDLSLGMLSDVGAAALLSGQPLTHLRRLDLHHHFLSDEMMDRLREELTPAGVDLDLSSAEGEQAEDQRYVAVAE